MAGRPRSGLPGGPPGPDHRGTSGIGRAAAARCAELGATVHLLGHNTTRATDALQSLRAQLPAGRFELELCDLQSLSDVRRFATDFAAEHDSLDALAHNAGVYSEHRQETPEGHERTYGVHVLAPHLLNHVLAPLLSRGGSTLPASARTSPRSGRSRAR